MGVRIARTPFLLCFAEEFGGYGKSALGLPEFRKSFPQGLKPPIILSHLRHD